MLPFLHLQVVHGEPAMVQIDPLSRVIPWVSRQVFLMSKTMLSTRQGSLTQRGQHSPSFIVVKLQFRFGQVSGQQSTSPSKHRHCWQPYFQLSPLRYSVCPFWSRHWLVTLVSHSGQQKRSTLGFWQSHSVLRQNIFPSLQEHAEHLSSFIIHT